MVKKALEGGKQGVAGAETAVDQTEQPTTLTVEPTIKILSEEEIQARIDSGVGKGLASINQQLSQRRAEADTAKAEAAQHKAEREAAEIELKIIREEQDKLLASQDDPEARRTYTDRVALARREAKAAREVAEATQKLQVAEQLGRSAKLATRALALVKETGIDYSLLEECQSEAEMDRLVKVFKLALPEEKESEVIQPDAGVSTGSATSFARTQARYANGEASREEYEKAAREAGVAI